MWNIEVWIAYLSSREYRFIFYSVNFSSTFSDAVYALKYEDMTLNFEEANFVIGAISFSKGMRTIFYKLSLQNISYFRRKFAAYQKHLNFACYGTFNEIWGNSFTSNIFLMYIFITSKHLWKYLFTWMLFLLSFLSYSSYNYLY